MAAGGVDRLSELPNDILRRILRFAPLKEAASTTALSRRWGKPLWLSSGGINLEMGAIEKKTRRRRHARFFPGTDDFVSAATAALDAAEVPVRRLTLITWHPDYGELRSSYKGLFQVLLSHRAARHVEELLLDAKDPYHNPHNLARLYTVALHSLPSQTLRILELTSCDGLVCGTAETVLPRLSSLRLSNCCQSLASLQQVIDAAPALAVIRLESVKIDATDKEAGDSTRRRLRCPATTVLVLDDCTWPLEIRCPGGWYLHQTVDPLEIDATRLRHFSYKGPLPPYKFSPRPRELEQVDLEIFEEDYEVEDPNQDLKNFWKFARNFTSTKEVRLKVDQLEDIAILSEERQVKLLPTFRRLERLVFQGAHWTKDKTAALTTILNLLHCCPKLSHLRINLTANYEEDESSNKEEVVKRTTRKEILAAAMVGPRYLFQCLQSSLRRVDLQFQLEKKDCFGVKLMKIFAENAMVLKEMRMDSGDEKLCEHMNRRVAKWNSSRRELGATSFVVLPLNAMANAPASTSPSQVHVGGAGEVEKRGKKTTACKAKPPPAEEHPSSSQKGKKKGGKRR